MPNLSENNTKYFMAVHRAMSLTFRRYESLMDSFHGDWESVWNASASDLRNADIENKAIDRFISARKEFEPEQLLEVFIEKNIHCVGIEDQNYPLSLKDIYNPPVMFFTRGELRQEDFPGIAVVGARRMSSYGQRVIDHLVGDLARQGITIVSGLALGVDVAAHKATVKAGGRTIAVLGNGIDMIYPATNRAFGEQMLAEETGVICSEYFPGVEARAEFFPHRNRIVMGMSRAAIVIEAAMRSGSLITARLGLEQGKDVFAVPGEIFSDMSEGTNWLLTKGEAYAALSAEQIMEQLNMDGHMAQKSLQQRLPLGIEEMELMVVFENESKLHIDEIIRRAGQSAPVVSSMVAMLELKGYVCHTGNQVYAKNI